MDTIITQTAAPVETVESLKARIKAMEAELAARRDKSTTKAMAIRFLYLTGTNTPANVADSLTSPTSDCYCPGLQGKTPGPTISALFSTNKETFCQVSRGYYKLTDSAIAIYEASNPDAKKERIEKNLSDTYDAYRKAWFEAKTICSELLDIYTNPDPVSEPELSEPKE